MSYDFKSEKDIREYLKNLYTEYSFGCLSEKNPEVCHLLGEYHEAIKRDFKKSAEIFKNNCDNFNFARSCTKYGRCNVTGSVGVKDMKTAFQYMRKGCKFGDGNGCLHAGYMTITDDDIGVDKNAIIPEGLQMLKKSCLELNEPKACFLLGSVYYSGKVNNVEKDMQSAFKFFSISCESGNPVACLSVAQMYSRGDGVEKNEELSNTFRIKAAEFYKEMRGSQGIEFQQGAN